MHSLIASLSLAPRARIRPTRGPATPKPAVSPSHRPTRLLTDGPVRARSQSPPRTRLQNLPPPDHDSQGRTGRLRMPRSPEPTPAAARPPRLSVGNSPTRPWPTGTRLSAELSRLSPITNR